MNFFVEKLIFYIGHLCTKPRVLLYYLQLRRNEMLTLEELNAIQEKKIKKLLLTIKKKTNFYSEIIPEGLNNVNADVRDTFRGIPVVDKDFIKCNLDRFIDGTLASWRWKECQTGGSTGSPFKYRISKRCNDMALAILYRGWGRGGYRLGDRLAVLAGGSLVAKTKTLKSQIVEKMLNVRKYSSYGVSDELFFEYFRDMKTWNPKFIRGYVSAIYEFACFVEKHRLNISFDSVFTTGEMLGDKERKYIEKTFSAKVYNNYGLNDGGISAFECRNGCMHIDMERGYLEVLIENKDTKEEKTYGRLLATDTLNNATYFVRYDTGDLGSLSSTNCVCGSPYPVLKNIAGRKTDSLRINNRIVGSPVLTVLMSHVPVNKYQFVQEGESLLVIIDKNDDEYFAEHEAFISKSLHSQLGQFVLEFIYDVKYFRKTSAGKHLVVLRVE